MIALLMAGQHSSSSTIAWIILRLASRPDITEELWQNKKKFSVLTFLLSHTMICPVCLSTAKSSKRLFAFTLHPLHYAGK